MDNLRAYGAGLANSNFDKNAFLKKPTVVFRVVALIAGFVLWYAVTKGGWHLPSDSIHPVCIYGRSSSTCSFATAMGFFAVCAAVCLLILDAKLDTITSVPTRRRAVIADLGASAVFAGIFLIAFFTFWSKLSSFEQGENDETDLKTGYAKLGILSAFFSLLSWSGAAFFAWRRYEEGAQAVEGTVFEQVGGNVAGDVTEGYGYGGDSGGIGSVGTATAPQSYQAGGPPQQYQQQPPQQPAPNPFVASEGYGY